MQNKKWYFGFLMIFILSVLIQLICFTNIFADKISHKKIVPNLSESKFSITSIDLPRKFDLRDLNKVSPSKDQGDDLNCWCYAACASLESYLSPDKHWWDFSEFHMDNYNGFTTPSNNNSVADTQRKACAYLARWDGPVVENSNEKPYHIQDIYFIPNDIESIKRAVYQYGAVFFSTTLIYEHYSEIYKSYYSSEGYSTTSQYAKTLSISGSPHAMAIIGWDDDFPKTNYYSEASGDGAFIVKNSYLYSDCGKHIDPYFYFSYYVPTRDVTAFTAEPASNYAKIYQYDQLGMGAEYKYGFGSEIAWGANIFQASADESLKAVSFYTYTSYLDYEIYIYNKVNPCQPRSSNNALCQSGRIDSGYHTVKLNTPVPLQAGDLFSVVVKFINPPGDLNPIYYEKANNSVINPGESFSSSDGINWNDCLTTSNPYNICIKAFSSEKDQTPGEFPNFISFPFAEESICWGTAYKIRWDGRQFDDSKGRIFLYKNGLWITDIANNYNLSSGSFSWFVDKDYYGNPLPMGSGYTIRLANLINGKNIVQSESGAFSITDQCGGCFKKPVAEENVSLGTTYRITWDGGKYYNIKGRIFLFKDGYWLADLANGYYIDEGYFDWFVDKDYYGNPLPMGSGYTIRLTDDKNKTLCISDEFSLVPLQTYTITAKAFAGGTITPSGIVTLNQGNNQTFAISADPGYTIQNVLVDGTSQGIIQDYTFNNVNSDHTIEAAFTPAPSYIITASAGPGGTISPAGQIQVSAGNSQTFTITPAAGYTILDVKVNGVSKGTIASYRFDNVQDNQTIEASFKIRTFTVTADVKTGNGWILPEWTYYKVMTVNYGTNLTIQLSPRRGYVGYYIEISGTVNGRFNYPGNDQIVINNINSDTSVSIYYRKQ